MRTPFLSFFAAACIGFLAGCTPGSSAIYQTLQDAIFPGDPTSNAQLNPNLRYLRAVIDGRTALLVLGDFDQGATGAVEVWYSAQREVLRLRNGRLLGVAGLTTEWRNVSYSAEPSWASVARTGGVMPVSRVRDVMPGYRYSVKDELSLRPTQPPARSNLAGMAPQSLAWFEETMPAGKDALPPARYAVDLRNGQEVVVYGEQCIAPTLCFSWQRWPVAGQGGK